MAEFDCVIFGGGINALVCAAVLAKKGHAVCVLERNHRLGGCIRTDQITEAGFIHDVLSSWYPLFVTSPAYVALGADLERLGVEFCNTDRPRAVVLPDDRAFVPRRSRDDNAAAMERIAGGDGERYRRALGRLEESLDLTFTLLGSQPWSGSTARALLRGLWRLGPHGMTQYFGWSLQRARLAGNRPGLRAGPGLPRALGAACRSHTGFAGLRPHGARHSVHIRGGRLSCGSWWQLSAGGGFPAAHRVLRRGVAYGHRCRAYRDWRRAACARALARPLPRARRSSRA